jgi:hypothetical protein
LLDHPDWANAAQVLIDACAHLPDPSQRLDFMDGACRALGPQLYPAFLEVLTLVSERGSSPAQAAVADTLADALASGRIPAAPHPGWGRTSSGAASALGALGPVEYVCARFLQPANAAMAVSASALESVLRPLLQLIAHSPRASGMYCDRLEQAAANPLESLWTRSSRPALHALADQWRRAPTLVDAAVDALLRHAQDAEAPASSVFGLAEHWAAHRS